MDSLRLKHGFGTISFPERLIIADREVANQEDPELRPTEDENTREIKITQTYQNNTSIVVTDDGFFGVIGCNEDTAIKIMNTIFATGVMYENSKQNGYS